MKRHSVVALCMNRVFLSVDIRFSCVFLFPALLGSIYSKLFCCLRNCVFVIFGPAILKITQNLPYKCGNYVVENENPFFLWCLKIFRGMFSHFFFFACFFMLSSRFRLRGINIASTVNYFDCFSNVWEIWSHWCSGNDGIIVNICSLNLVVLISPHLVQIQNMWPDLAYVHAETSEYAQLFYEYFPWNSLVNLFLMLLRLNQTVYSTLSISDNTTGSWIYIAFVTCICLCSLYSLIA